MSDFFQTERSISCGRIGLTEITGKPARAGAPAQEPRKISSSQRFPFANTAAYWRCEYDSFIVLVGEHHAVKSTTDGSSTVVRVGKMHPLQSSHMQRCWRTIRIADGPGPATGSLNPSILAAMPS